MKRVNEKGAEDWGGKGGGAGEKMGVASPPPPPLYYRHPQMSLRTMISKLLIFNVAGQSQILILHSLLTALTIPQSLILLASLLFPFISLSVYLIPPSFCLLTHTHFFSPSLSRHSLSFSWVLEDLSKPGGRKSTFLPHQLAKPGVEKAQLKALLLLMLTANANVPFAKHEGQWAQAKG